MIKKKTESKVKRNILLVFIVLLLCPGFARAQNQTERPWWYTLEQGKLKFRSGDYGDALLTFEDARRQRRAVYERMEQDFIELLSIHEVRRLGDSLDWVDRYATERHYAGAAAALEELYYRVPKESLHNSASAALAVLSGLKDYPEAEYWIGETYRVEGELGLALSQFQKAYEQRSLFENPAFSIELLYKIADIHKKITIKDPNNQYTQRSYNDMERTLLSIIEMEDDLWPNENRKAGQAASFTLQAMNRTLESENGISRFLALYRYNNPRVEEAHRFLGFYYTASGRHSRAQEHLMFAFLIQNTVIIEEIIRHQYDFTFTTMENLLAEIKKYPLLSAYTAKVDYYKTAYYLGVSLYGNGKAAARSFWQFLSVWPEAGEWQNRAAGQLRSPHLERAVEMP